MPYCLNTLGLINKEEKNKAKMRKIKRVIYILLFVYALKEVVMQHNFNDCHKIGSSQQHL